MKDKPWLRQKAGKPHIYRRAGRWCVSWMRGTENIFLLEAHNWAEQANGSGLIWVGSYAHQTD